MPIDHIRFVGTGVVPARHVTHPIAGLVTVERSAQEDYDGWKAATVGPDEATLVRRPRNMHAAHMAKKLLAAEVMAGDNEPSAVDVMAVGRVMEAAEESRLGSADAVNRSSLKQGIH